MSAPIYNPVIPCVHTVPGGMFPGRMIRVQGNIPPGAQRFAINLQCGPNTDPRDDIALHLNFRFVEMCVVRNHLTAMNWGVEDTAGGMPLVRGEAFEALILCDQQSMKIALNGGHFCEFPHRVPYQRISHLTVDGDVMVQFIGFEGAQAPPQQMYMSEPPAYGSYGAPPPAYGAPAYGAPQGYGGGQRSPKPIDEPNAQEKPTNSDHPSLSSIQIEQPITIPEDTGRRLDATFTPSLAARLERLLEESLQQDVDDDTTSMSSSFTAGTTQTDQSFEEAPQRPTTPTCPIPESYSYYTLATESIFFTPINPNPNQHIVASLESDQYIDDVQYETGTYQTENLDLHHDNISIEDKQASCHITEDAQIVQNDQKLAICKGLLDLSYVDHNHQASQAGQPVEEFETSTMTAENPLVYNAAGQPPPYVKAAIDGAQAELALLDRQGLAQPIFGQPYSNLPSPQDNQSDIIQIIQPESSNVDNQADCDKQGEQLNILDEPGLDLTNELPEICHTGKDNQFERFGLTEHTDVSAELPAISDKSPSQQPRINHGDIDEQRQQLGQPSRAFLRADGTISQQPSDQTLKVATDGSDDQLKIGQPDEPDLTPILTNIQQPPVAVVGTSVAGQPDESNRENQPVNLNQVDSKQDVKENQSSSQIKQRDSKVTFNTGSVLVTKTSRQPSSLNQPSSPVIINGKSVAKVDDLGGGGLVQDDIKAISPKISRQSSSINQVVATDGKTVSKVHRDDLTDIEFDTNTIVVRIPQIHSINLPEDQSIEKVDGMVDSTVLVDQSTQGPEQIRRWARLKRFILDRWLKVQSYETAAYAQPVAQRRGLGTGAAVGLGVGALAAGGLAGYALGGGFSSSSPPRDEVQVADIADFGGDDWMD